VRRARSPGVRTGVITVELLVVLGLFVVVVVRGRIVVLAHS
jgi:hypothetical protein